MLDLGGKPDIPIYSSFNHERLCVGVGLDGVSLDTTLGQDDHKEFKTEKILCSRRE
jgi:hypothetical protein